jgi:hypothetical protein
MSSLEAIISATMVCHATRVAASKQCSQSARWLTTVASIPAEDMQALEFLAIECCKKYSR